MSYVSTALTTERVRELAAKGKRIASGSTVMSTRDSASKAYLEAIQKVARRDAFIAAQQQTARQAAEERTAQMITVTNNSRQLPQSDAQQGGGFRNNQVRNNIVNPSSLYPTQPTVTNGQGQNSTMNYGLSTDSNYNYASQMNDFTFSNPSYDINMGLANPQQTNFGSKSSVPKDNDVSTENLGGDIQHQETDVNTNVEYANPTVSVPSDTNWEQSGVKLSHTMPILGSTGIILGGIAALLLLGKKK